MKLTLRGKQVLAVLAGAVVAVGMLGLGLWQMDSYEESTRDVSAERAAEASSPLADAIDDNGTIADIYGRRVTFAGEYEAQHQVLVGDSDPLRVATAFRMEDGRYVTVVRGSVASGSQVPPPPAGSQDLEGIFLAPDLPSDGPGASGADLATLRVQELAQGWPSPLVAGYVTLPASAAAEQGLSEAPVLLPEAEGSATHRGYALQWWVFAAAAVAFGVYAARGFAKDEEKRQARLAKAQVGAEPELKPS